MRKIYLILTLSVAAFLSSCTEESSNILSSGASGKTDVINKSGASDGVQYSLNDLEINPDLVKISSENATLTSSEASMQQGSFSLQSPSDDIKEKLVEGTIIYVKSGDNSYLRKINSVSISGNNYNLGTSEAYLGDLFNGGSIELSVNTQQAEKAIQSRTTGSLLATKDYSNSFTFDIFNLIQEYKYGGMILNPNTSISSTFNMKIGFGNSRILPNEVVAYYELNTSMHPYYKFEGAFNKKITHNLIENVPANLLELLKKIEVDITIPAGEVLGNIPAKISINEINFPVEIEANIAKSSNIEFNASGNLKVGFAYYNGVPNKTSHFIYENSITNSSVVKSDLVGELTSDMKISIIPKVTLFNTDLIDVNGTITFGLKTFSVGGASVTNETGFASKGDFYSSGVFSFGSFGIPLYTTELFKNNKELWNIGNYTKTFTVSNFRSYKNSAFPCYGLTSYSFTAALDYKYPLTGKVITGDLEMTYDVYADNGRILEQGKKVKLTPTNITDKGFNFTLCIPFRKISFFSVAKTSYLRNITIKDANGYIATDVIDPSTGAAYSQIKITR